MNKNHNLSDADPMAEIPDVVSLASDSSDGVIIYEENLGSSVTGDRIDACVNRSDINCHCTKVQLEMKKGKNKGKKTMHFQCNYCSKAFAEMAGDRTDGTVSENPQGEPIVGKYLKRKRTANIMETEYDRY